MTQKMKIDITSYWVSEIKYMTIVIFPKAAHQVSIIG